MDPRILLLEAAFDHDQAPASNSQCSKVEISTATASLTQFSLVARSTVKDSAMFPCHMEHLLPFRNEGGEDTT